MLSACERQLLFFYLRNAASRLHHACPGAKSLAEWVTENRDLLELEEDGAESEEDPQVYERKLSAREWRRLRETLERKHSACEGAPPDRTAQRLRFLGREMDLAPEDVAILELLLRYRAQPALESLIDAVGDGFRRHRLTLNVTNPYLACLLGLSSGAFLSRFTADAPLMKAGLVSVDYDGDLEPVKRLYRLVHLPDEDGTRCARPAARRGGAGRAGVVRFRPRGRGAGPHREGRAGRPALRRQGGERPGIRPAGDGQDRVLQEPGRPARDEPLRRRRGGRRGRRAGPARAAPGPPVRPAPAGRRAAGRCCSSTRWRTCSRTRATGWIPFSPFGSSKLRSGGSKVFMNRLLERAPVPTLWTSNAARETCPTVLRRMTFALELRPPPCRTRARIWSRELARHGIEATEEDAGSLAREFEVAPGLASGAVAAASLCGGDLAAVRRGVRSLSRVISGDKPPCGQGAPERFDPALIRADVDPVRLAERLEGTGNRRFSLCLQGPPGTGKSAFVRYLAEGLGLQVTQKRASDLMSMWVGQTEQQIAAAFAEARAEESILVFDEADSLLADRRGAVRSWEVSQVNEMLTWMESHPLPFACTTNFGEHLDPATLRRFTFKIALGYLTSAQSGAAFRAYFEVEAPPEVEELSTLTPGDFAVVRRKAAILGHLQDPQALAGLLRAECEAKPGHRGKIGFRNL